MKAGNVVAKLSLLGAACLGVFAAAAPVAVERGGSNFNFYKFDYAKERCGRDDFTILQNYHEDKPAVDAILRQMYAKGQRRLRLGMYFRHPPAQTLELANLGEVLKTIKEIGFEQVIVSLGIGYGNPANWTEWHEDLYRQSWDILQRVRATVVASGVNYLFDLGNEGIPAANQKMLLQFAKRKWADYAKSYGTADTLGFSIITDIRQDRFAQIPAVYAGRPPAVFDLHIYGDGNPSAKALFLNAHERLSQLGYGKTPWIIGETLYDDRKTAQELREAIDATHQRVLFLLQWQLSRGAPKPCDGTDVVPVDFGAYISSGF